MANTHDPHTNRHRREPRTLRRADTAKSAVAVLGLGRFGSALAKELMHTGAEVLGIDHRPEVVQAHNGLLTHVVTADATQEEVLRQLGVPEFQTAVVGIGSTLEASILTTSMLMRFGIENLWAKAVSDAHSTILEQLGVEHIVHPEHDMGRRVAHLVRGRMQDFMPVDNNFVLVRTFPPRFLVGVSLGQSNLRKKHDVTVVAAKPVGGEWTHATTDTVLKADDLILVSGSPHATETFAQIE